MSRSGDYFSPAPKPTPSKKRNGSGGKSKKPSKSVDMEAVDAKIRERNNRNRGFGRNVEKQVAALLGGDRIPMSGAIKNGNFGLVGDVRVTHRGSTLALIECKGTSGVSATGDKTFTCKRSVLDQITDEAASVSAHPALFIHWRNANYELDDWVVLPLKTFGAVSQFVGFWQFRDDDGIAPKGEKTYTLRKAHLETYLHAAQLKTSYPAIHLVWKDGATFVIIPVRAYIEVLDWLRQERDAELEGGDSR